MGGLLGGIQHPVGVDFAALLLLAHLFPPRGALGPGDVTQDFPLLALAHLHGAFTQTAAPHQAALHLGLEIWRGKAMEGRWQVWKELPWSLVYVPDHWSHVSPPKLPPAGRAQLLGGGYWDHLPFCSSLLLTSSSISPRSSFPGMCGQLLVAILRCDIMGAFREEAGGVEIPVAATGGGWPPGRGG